MTINVLVYDESRLLGTLVRSVLRASGQRASVSSEPTDAVLKLDTALFDAVIVDPAGAPRVLADYLDEEMSHLPILLVGCGRGTPAVDRIQAVLPSPLDLRALVSAVRKLDVDPERIPSGLHASIRHEEGEIRCLAQRISRAGMVVEHGAAADEFHSFFARVGGRPLRAAFEEAASVEFLGSVKYVERSPSQRVCSAGIAFEPVEETLWESLCRGIRAGASPERRPVRTALRMRA